MAASGQVKLIDHGDGQPKMVHYLSVVRLCDHIRVAHDLPDRRPQLHGASLRHRDEDLLPFPLRETIAVETALKISGLAKLEQLLLLIEQRCFEAYRLTPDAPWRISRPSLLAYCNRA